MRRVAAALVLLLLATAAPTGAEMPARGRLRLLVVLTGFPDHPLASPRSHFTGQPQSLVDRMVAYYTEVSAGRLTIEPTVGELVVTVPQPRASYQQRPDALARDALAAFAADATAPADRRALADADALVVFFAGTGRESHMQAAAAAADDDDPWSNYTAVVPAAVGGGRSFDQACVIAEEERAPFGSFGVLCHEFGHLLGLPELYAPGGLPQEGIGVWGLMGQGTWLGKGERPPHPCAWSKVQLGWVDLETIAVSTRGVTLDAVEKVPRVIKIPADPARPQEYYLLENRARIGADASLPGAGLLVWHVDDSVGGFRTAQVNAAHKRLHLVEADGKGDLDRGHAAGGNRGDAGDPWVGPPAWRRIAFVVLALAGAILVAGAVVRGVRPRPLAGVLVRLGLAAAALGGAAMLQRAPVCGPGTPGMAPYGGGPARVVIRNLSPAGERMRFDVLVAPVSQPD